MVVRRYEVISGATDSPVILHVPHASTRIDDDARRHILLTDAALRREIDLLTDAHTDVVAARATAVARSEPFRFVNLMSRLVVDPERFPDEREEMRAVGMGAVYTRTAHGDQMRDTGNAHVEHLLATYYRPYAAAMTSTVDERLAATGRAVVIDVHSYPSRALPYELHADLPRPAICLGTDPFHTPPGLLEQARTVFGAFQIAENTPFSGCYVPLEHFRKTRELAAIMIEIRRDIYLDEPGGPPHDGLAAVVEGLADLINLLSAR